jgi:hypothetical protein
MLAPEKQDANFVGFYIAREASLKQLPEIPVFQTREPNTFGDFGAEYARVTRSPFNATRQQKKGSNSDVDVSGGWNEDLTQNNMLADIEAFCFANVRRKGIETVTGVVAADDHFAVASEAGFAAGDLIAGSGFARGPNNGLHRVTAVAAGKVTVATALSDEATVVGGPAKIEIAGHQFAAGDLSLTAEPGRAKLASAAIDMRNFGFLPGEWCAVGGDQAGTRFDDVSPFYARISEVGEDAIYFDKTTQPIVDDDGAGKTVQLFFGYLVRNEDDPDNIVRHTHVVERTLGKDAVGTQSELLRGFVFNEMTWTSPLANKVSLDIAGVGLGYQKRKGAEGPLFKEGGTVLKKALGEDAFNTSRNVYRIRMSIIDPETLNPTPMFARCTEWTARIANNVTAAKAQGSYGGFDTTVGLFNVSMTTTAYFTTVEATEAIEEEADVTFDAIYAKDNAAIIMDIPLIGVGGGRLTVEQNAAIMLPLTGDGAESPFGHTFLLNWLPYIPNALMPTGA